MLGKKTACILKIKKRLANTTKKELVAPCKIPPAPTRPTCTNKSLT